MTDAVIAQKEPYEAKLEEGKNYAWCACGRSQIQPFCDGAHKVTDIKPIVFKAEKTETVWFCGCKQTAGQPYCDGTHASL